MEQLEGTCLEGVDPFAYHNLIVYLAEKIQRMAREEREQEEKERMNFNNK